MERYEKYKDSGVEWIGEIPDAWEVKKLKYIANASPSNIDKKSIENEKSVFLCNYVDVYNNEFISSNISFMPATANEEQIRKFILKKDDVIATKDSETPDDIANPALVIEDFENVVCGYHLTHIKPKTITGRYLFRFFQTNYLNAYFEVSANGVTRYGLGVDKFNSALILNPPLNEQIAIANYLDCKTAEIDKLIAQKERLIELYEEEKAAIINQAVTKGIDPNAKLKDSGVDWLGEIPEGWGIIALKRLVNKITDGEHISPKFTQTGMPFLSAKDVRDGYIQIPDDKFVDYEDGVRFRRRCDPEQNDILLVSRGATVGRVAVIDTNVEFCLLGSVILLKPKSEISSLYLFYLLKNRLVQNYFFYSSQSSAQQAIYLEKVATVYLAMPTIEEQIVIVDFIETEIACIDAKIAKTKRIIELQKEYRTALISEVVTGKVKVLEEATP
jgi:type I restriction enzyme, S subunit